MALVVSNGYAGSSIGRENIKEAHNVDHQLVEICLTSIAGLGLFAKQNIPRGTRMLSETPLMTIPEAGLEKPLKLYDRLKDLPPAQLDIFDSLACNRDLLDPKDRSVVRDDLLSSSRVRSSSKLFDGLIDAELRRVGIFCTNATKIGPEKKSAVFELYSRINHSCTPNVHASYNHSLDRHTLHAIYDISEGEEILTSYIECAKPLDKRTEALEEKGIDCYCSVCTRGAVAFRSNKRRKKLYDLTRGLQDYDGTMSQSEQRVPASLIPRNPGEALTIAENSITLVKDEGLLGMSLASTYRRCSKYALQLGMVEKAKAYAKKELEVERYCLGMETEYLNDGRKGGNAESWMKQIEWSADKDRVKLRMCEKRCQKEQKKAEKKAEKKAAKKATKG